MSRVVIGGWNRMSQLAWRRTVVLAAMLALVAPLAGCGKRGDLELPDGRKSEYPRTYPSR